MSLGDEILSVKNIYKVFGTQQNRSSRWRF
jgi:hypothetical protein